MSNPKRSNYRLVLLIKAALMTSVISPSIMAEDTLYEINTQQYALNITADNLTDALTQLGQQANLLISFSSDTTQNIRSNTLHGHYTAPAALGILLADNGLAYRQNGPTSFTIIRLPGAENSTSSAEVDSTVTTSVTNTIQSQLSKEPILKLPQIDVIGENNQPEIKKLQTLDIRSTLRSDLAEAVAILPSVRVDNTASSSLQQGDIKPAEFSIRGAAPYQNKLVLDGASIDSRLDPALEENLSNYTQVAGHSQSLFIDPNFIQEIEVIDVNVSARDGGFTGGVIKAETRAYRGQNEFEIRHRKTQDSWTEFHIDEAQVADFTDGAGQLPVGLPGEYQPNFRKSETAIQGATRLGNIGIFAGLSQKKAEIKQKQTIALDFDHFFATGRLFKPSDETSLDRESRYGVVRLDLLEADYDVNLSIAYSDYKEDSFIINYLDSDFKANHNGLNVSLNAGKTFDNTRLDWNISLGTNADERKFSSNVLDSFNYLSIYEGAYIGGYGDLANQQYALNSHIELNTVFNPLWQLRYGGEIKLSHALQDRGNDFTFNEYSFDAGGSYHSREVIYAADKIKFTNLDLAAFAELHGESQRFFWRTGLRIERDDWLDNTNIAPRASAGIYLDQNKQFRIIAGANRYYGKSFLAYRLREKERNSMTIRERANSTAAWVAVDPNAQWEFHDLKTPYDDELSLGIYGTAFKGQWGLQYVHRDGNKQIRTVYDDVRQVSWFGNTGNSETQQVDLFWRSAPLHFAHAQWHVNTSLGWMDKETDTNYGANGGYLSNNNPNEEVMFEGRRIRLSELPASDFATPVVANLDIVTLAFNERLMIKNNFSYSNGYKYIRSLGNDPTTGLRNYEVKNQGKTTRWDLSVEYQLLNQKSSPYIRADVINVTDRKNVISNEAGTQLFGLGRQFWFEVGYRY